MREAHDSRGRANDHRGLALGFAVGLLILVLTQAFACGNDDIVIPGSVFPTSAPTGAEPTETPEA